MRLLRQCAFVLAVGFVGCDYGDVGPNISGVNAVGIVKVQVFPQLDTAFIPDTITAADEVKFEAVAFARTGAPIGGMRFVWTSSDVSVAVVDTLGVVTPVAPGETEISASAGKIGRAKLVVVPATATVQIVPLVDTILVDQPIDPARDTLQLVAVARDRFGDLLTGVRFIWQASSGSIAAINEAGVARAVAPGTVTVTVRTTSGLTATSLLVILPVVKNVQVTSPVTKALVSDTVQLSGRAFDYNDRLMPGQRFFWTSSAPNVATVDTLGRVVIRGLGTALITGASAFRTASVSITTFERKLLSASAGGDYSCGLTAVPGRAFCWGLEAGLGVARADSTCVDDNGNTAPCTLLPQRFTATTPEFTQISTGDGTACGVATDRQVYCWAGELGNGRQGSGPATVANERFTFVSSGSGHSCALNLTGRAYCWGADADGQLGDTLRALSTTPIPVRDRSGAFPTFTAISAGGRHTCAIATGGLVFCWGDGTQGQRGDGSVAPREMPSVVAGVSSAVAISAGGQHTCAIASGGSVFCWGDNSTGQLGNPAAGALSAVPVAVAGGGTFIAISAGDRHTCGIVTGGSVRCWGSSRYGQVGDGAIGPHNVMSPVTVVGPFVASSVSAGLRHTCAIGVDTQAYCWGSNMFGALGTELQAAPRESPQRVATPR